MAVPVSGEGGGPNPPYGEDFFGRIVNVHWRKKKVVGVAEQGLLETYPYSGKIAIALDTGQTFSGVSTGASGQLISQTPFTVLSKGIVVYGKPKGGDACFMACTDGKTILRGFEELGVVSWQPVFTVPRQMTALSFAGDAFFVTYNGSESEGFCGASFDGLSFQSVGDPFAGVPLRAPRDNKTSGPVAHNGNSYVAVGDLFSDIDYPTYLKDCDNMMWGSSSDGQAWSPGYAPTAVSNPGISNDGVFLSQGDFAGSTGILVYVNVTGGAGLFVAAASDCSQSWPFFDSAAAGEEAPLVIRSTASAAVSSDGNSWTMAPLPGVVQGDYTGFGATNNASYGEAVAFIKTGGGGGYFLMTSNGGTQHGEAITSEGWLHKGDGHSWSLLSSYGGSGYGLAGGYGAVSAIARDLGATTIVQV